MGKSELLPRTSIPLTTFRKRGIDILNEPDNVLNISLGPQIPIYLSPSRGGIHTLTDPSKPITLVANLGAQFMNAGIYYQPDYKAREMVIHNEQAQTASVLAFTQPEDTLIVPLHDEGQKIAIDVVRESWNRVGIAVSEHVVYTAPKDVDYADQKTPFILSPDALLQNGVEIDDAFAQVAAYTKNGPVAVWEEDGVPIPPNYFIEGSLAQQGMLGFVAEELKGWDQVVLNSTNGSGGFGIFFLDTADLKTLDVATLFDNAEKLTLQIQPKIELDHSPCIIATIQSDGSFSTQHMSEQRFTTPGAHGGNIWHEDIEQEVIPDGGQEVVYAAIQSLATRGIRGQVNLDFLTVNIAFAHKHEISDFLVREANTRPAGSSAQIRMRDISIDNIPVKRIHTKTGITITKEMLVNGDIFKLIDHLERAYGGSRILIYSANVTSDEHAHIHVGFLLNENDERKVEELESSFLLMLQGPTDTMN